MATTNLELLDELPGTGPIGAVPGQLVHVRDVVSHRDYRLPIARLPGAGGLAAETLARQQADAALATQVAGAQPALGYTPENVVNRGTANGYAPLGADAKVAAIFLPTPGNTDTVLEGAVNLYYTPARTLGQVLTGYLAATVNAAVYATDTLLAALGKLQKQITDNGVSITANTTAITANANSITANTTAITANTTNINGVSAAGAANSAAINLNTTAIALKADKVAARAINYYAAGVPNVALPDLQSQIDWLFSRTTTATPVANQAPTAAAPSLSAASVVSGGSVTATTTASDPDGTVASVEYFVDAVSKGVSTTGPSFALTFTATTVGSRVITCQATDNLGLKSAISAGTTLTVTGASTAPGAPTASTGTAGNNLVTVNATAPASNGGSAITGYTIYRNSSATALATNVALPYADATALNGTSYAYEVAAVNAIGTSAKSAISTAVTPQATNTLTANSSTPS